MTVTLSTILVPAIIFIVSLTAFVWFMFNYDYAYSNIYLISICVFFGIATVSFLTLNSVLLGFVFLCLH